MIEPGTRGVEAKLFDINMLVTVGGLERSAAEYAALLQMPGCVCSTCCRHRVR
ncbi:MAG TPA: hypothetical protein VFO28_19450 [Burkholderiaceae bacterium]|nr:hypothetical protein [Burkholderiaceae bacterium]